MAYEQTIEELAESFLNGNRIYVMKQIKLMPSGIAACISTGIYAHFIASNWKGTAKSFLNMLAERA